MLGRHVAATNRFVCDGESFVKILSQSATEFCRRNRWLKFCLIWFLQHAAATKFCCRDKDFHKNSPVRKKRFAAATCVAATFLLVCTNLKKGLTSPFFYWFNLCCLIYYPIFKLVNLINSIVCCSMSYLSQIFPLQLLWSFLTFVVTTCHVTLFIVDAAQGTVVFVKVAIHQQRRIQTLFNGRTQSRDSF